MTEVKTQTRTLQMDPNLLLDVIKRQCGTFDKALLEGGMNGIEAINALKMNGGTCKDESIYITYKKTDTTAIVTIQDYGKGITTKKEIEDFFETFGTPHEESEHKIYAQFRMGRGQMFSFGKNIWRTGTFELTVDVKHKGLEWDFKENLPFVDGCHITIELYEENHNRFPANTVDCLKESVKKQMEFVQSPIIFNGEQVNTPPQDCIWDFEDDFAWYNFKIGDILSIFNLGVFVQNKWNTKGIVVSKKQLKVNFARNDVMSDCPIWYHINEVVKKNVVQKSKKKYVSLSENERRAILKDVLYGQQEYNDIKGSRILQTAQDKYWSFSMFLKNRQPWTFAEVGSRQADTCIQQGSHVVFAREMLEAMNYSGEEKYFFDWLLKTLIDEDNDWSLRHAKDDFKFKSRIYETFDRACISISNKFTIVPQNKMTIIEKRLVGVFESFDCWDGRLIRIGIADSAVAWTDGRAYITLDRNYLKNMSLDWDGDISELFSTMSHELAHDNDTSNSDIHAEVFYENYHDITSRRGQRNPFTHVLTFKHKMRSALINERNKKIKAKKQEEVAEKARQLGISGSSTVETIAAETKVVDKRQL